MAGKTKAFCCRSVIWAKYGTVQLPVRSGFPANDAVVTVPFSVAGSDTAGSVIVESKGLLETEVDRVVDVF